jgi:WD40 repeat protein
MSIAESTNNPIASYHFPMWDNVPEDLTISLISTFDPKTLDVCGRQVCKRWKNFFESERVLPGLCRLHFPTIPLRKINTFPKFLSLFSNLPKALCSVTTLPGHTDEITAFVLVEAKYTDLLFSASQDKTVKIWDLQAKTCLGTLQYPSKVFSLARAEDRTLFAGCEDGTIRAWKNATLSLFAKEHTGRIKALLAKGKRLFSGSNDKTIRIWDMDTARCKGVLDVKGHKGPVNLLAISEDEKTLFSASRDKTVKAWDLNNNTCIDTLEGIGVPRSFALEPNGTLLISTELGVLRWPFRKTDSLKSNIILNSHQYCKNHTVAIAKTGMAFVAFSEDKRSYAPESRRIDAWDRRTVACKTLFFGNIAIFGPLVSGGGAEVIGCSYGKKNIQVLSLVATPLDILPEIASVLENASLSADWFGSFAKSQFDKLDEEIKNGIYIELHHCIGTPGQDPVKEGEHLFHRFERDHKAMAQAIRNYIRKARVE